MVNILVNKHKGFCVTSSRALYEYADDNVAGKEDDDDDDEDELWVLVQHSKQHAEVNSIITNIKEANMLL